MYIYICIWIAVFIVTHDAVLGSKVHAHAKEPYPPAPRLFKRGSLQLGCVRMNDGSTTVALLA